MVDLLQNTLHMFNLLQPDQVVEGQCFQGVIGGGGRVVGEGDRGKGACNTIFVYYFVLLIQSGTQFKLRFYYL